MALVVPNLGELLLLNRMLKLTSISASYILKLYKSNTTPDQNSGSNSFTEADFTNYTASTLTRANWNDSVTNGSSAAEASYNATLTWTCGASGNTIYGYWVEDSATSTVLWAERFSSSRVLASGDVLNITPKFTLASEN